MRKFIRITACGLLLLSTASQAQETLPVGRISREDLAKFRQIPPEQRRDAINQVQDKWQGMTAQEKDTLKEQVKSDFYSKSPAEQKQLEQEALKQWNAMSPDEQRQLKAAFPELEGEDLKPQNSR